MVEEPPASPPVRSLRRFRFARAARDRGRSCPAFRWRRRAHMRTETRRSRCACHGIDGTERPSVLPRPRGHLRRAIAECCERAGGPAELKDRQRDRAIPRGAPSAIERITPSSRLQPERDRRRLLQPGAARHGRFDMAFGMARRRVGRTVQVADDERHRASKLQDERGIDDVLAGRSPVNVTCGCGSVAATRAVRWRIKGIARLPSRTASASMADASNRSASHSLAIEARCLARNHAGAGFRLGQGRFDIEHRLQPRARREMRAHIPRVTH